VAKSLPPRPNLDHLRAQAKTLLDELRAGRGRAIQAFIDHLPDAKRMTPAAVRTANFRLADAQAVVARQTGFASWPGLAHHVEQLRGLEGEWRFERLEVDGNVMPAPVIANSRLLIDGDRFRTESPEPTYEGVFIIDVSAKPSHIDIEFVEGPEAGHVSYGLFELEADRLTLCLSVEPGRPRPASLTAKRGSGHALERLRRASADRPANVTGGTRPDERSVARTKNTQRMIAPATFDAPVTPMMTRLTGEWTPLELVMEGKPMPKEWLAFGSRTMTGNEMRVIFNGQTMAHAKVRVDDSRMPIAVDYLHLAGRYRGCVSLGIMEWIGEEVRFLIAAPGDPRPQTFDTVAKTATLSRWRRR